MKEIRLDHEFAKCTEEWGWKYHHLGVPTEEKLPDESYIPHLKIYASGFSTSPFGIEWMQFDADCNIHPLIRKVPHLAFVVKDLEYELATRNLNLLGEPNSPSGGLQVAMVEYKGAPIELMEFKNINKAGSTFDDILTDRLVIRLAKPDDAEEIYAYRSDTVENRYQGWLPESVEEVRNYITNMPVSMDIADVCFQFAILTKKENRLIGDMGIIFTGHERMQAEIGCTLNKDFQGKGYATEALTAMVNYFFVILKKHRVVASIDPRNTASIRLIERLGFKKEAHFKESYYLRGEWVDDIIYAMLKTEWVNNEIQRFIVKI